MERRCASTRPTAVGQQELTLLSVRLVLQANNMVFHTAVEHFWRSPEAAEHARHHGVLPHVITSNVEHDSVKLAAEHLQKTGRAGRRRWEQTAADGRFGLFKALLFQM